MQFDDIEAKHQNLSATIGSLLQHRQSESNALGHDTEKVLHALRRLQSAVQGPAGYLGELRSQPLSCTAITLALDRGVIAALCKRNRAPVTIEELGAETNVNEKLLVRLMRMLTTIHAVVDEIAPRVYAANDVTECLQGATLRSAFALSEETAWLMAGTFPSYLRSDGSVDFGLEAVRETPFAFTFQDDLWGLIARDQHKREVFDAHFAAAREGCAARWFTIFPIQDRLESLPEDDCSRQTALLVDIGGGWGQDISGFMQACKPDFRCARFVLQDLSRALDNIPEGTLDEQIEKMPYNFFESEQPVKGAHFYLMHDICHDYGESDAQKILMNTAVAMAPHSRLLIHDWVIRDNHPQFVACMVDWTMLCTFKGACERTLEQWKSLLDTSGLQIVQVWETNADSQSVIEVGLKSP